MKLEFNPVLVKELRGRMRGARAFTLLTIYVGILSGVTVLLYMAIAGNVGSDLNAGRRIGQALFFVIGAVALIEVCVFIPALTAGGIAGEKERQTYDLLVASLLTPWQIIWGKLLSSLAFALLLVLSVLPLMSLAFLFGGVSLAEVLIALVGLITTSVFYACIGLFWSAVMRSTLGAISFAIGSVALMLLGIPFLAVIFTLIFGSFINFWNHSALLVYLGGGFLSTQPFIALFMTESLLREGQGIFYSFIDIPGGGQVLIPSPWLAYVGLATFFSTILVLLSVRLLRPTGVETPVRLGKRRRRGLEEGA